MTDAERLELVAAILGLQPSQRDWQGRAHFWAFLIADGASEEAIAEARQAVEELRPGWPARAATFAREKRVPV